LTIPRTLVEEMEWFDVQFVILKQIGMDVLSVRRFIDAESLKTKDARDRTGCD